VTRTTKIVGVAVFLAVVLVGIPVFITVSERWDLYYTLTSVALLSIASGGVWLTFYIGRINIGQGAYALMGGYVSAILVVKYGVSFWLTLPIAGLFCGAASVLIGLPILRLRGVYFAMVTLVLTEVARLLMLALPITNGAKGITGGREDIRPHPDSGFRHTLQCEAGVLLPFRCLDDSLFCRTLPLG
jgi:branched-chain amino acid transport system permease protein